MLLLCLLFFDQCSFLGYFLSYSLLLVQPDLLSLLIRVDQVLVGLHHCFPEQRDLRIQSFPFRFVAFYFLFF